MHDVEIAKRVAAERDEEAQAREGHERRDRRSATATATTVLLRVPGSCRLRCTFARICSIPRLPSAAGWVSTAGTVPDTNPRSDRPVEDPDPLPSLEELFSDFQSEGYVERLEELAASLMREVTIGMEANPHRTDEQVCVTEDPAKKSDRPEAMVGQASEDVEADRVRESINNVPYIPDTSDWHTNVVVRDTESSTAPIKTEIEIKQESDPTPDLDTVYGTYDEATNSITIIYPGEESDGCVGIQECVQEVISTENTAVAATHLTVPPLTTHPGYLAQFSPAYTDTMSPATSDVHSDADSCGVAPTKLDYANLSDGGYESHDSPDPRLSNNNALADPWHESFTELFPMLA